MLPKEETDLAMWRQEQGRIEVASGAAQAKCYTERTETNIIYCFLI